ncbi:hypothetical protein PENARI_c200G11632 [Penicillium arizonense]|uniref:Uncharacterized protein n=1 Tax=Penicillium arizonense TaxID=1835702 RepID=A0A1F5L0N1_PENAI|nr:hypothetical protein PENARI_c200G11632 [Penicillium arizonense]OGE46540.1 hypothetical protein PENARI_c200G11632 [Penicillium arizonense]
MGAIQKHPFTDQRQSFRSRLQRALSLSSSGSEDIWIPPRSAAGDTTEDERSEEDDSFGNYRNGMAADDGQESLLHTCSTVPRPDEELEQPGQDLSENCNMIAFQCLAELDVRTKSMQNSLNNQNSWIGNIRSDLEEIRSRLAVVETAIEMRAKKGESNATEGDISRRSLRSQK